MSRRLAITILSSSLPFIALACKAAPDAAAPATPATQAEAPVSCPLTCLILSSDYERAGNLPVPGSRFLVADGIPIFQTKEFARVMAPFEGRQVSMDLINAIANAISDYAKKHDRVSVNVDLPKQDATTGVIRLCLHFGKINKLTVVGNHWFSQKQILADLGLKLGQEVKVSEIDAGVNYANASLFHNSQIAMTLDPKDASKVDMTIYERERFPLRATFSFDNAGIASLGSNEFSVNLTYGNLWGKEHTLIYEYKTTSLVDVLNAHNLAYKIPLPWKHSITVQAAYAKVDSTYYYGYFKQSAANYITRINYSAPFKFKWGEAELNAGIDYKQAASDQFFRSDLTSNDFSNTDSRTYDIFQYFLSGTFVRRDKFGALMVGATAYISPGGFNSRNHDYNWANVGGDNPQYLEARYAYGQLSAQRTFKLPFDFELLFQGVFQGSTRRLEASEQLTIGGTGTVRGYDERIFSGDMGYVFSTELHTPVKRVPLKFMGKHETSAAVQGIAFLDTGLVRYKYALSSDYISPQLESAGVGMRAALSNKVYVAADYGWVIKTLRNTVGVSYPMSCRASVKASLTF